MKDCYRERTDAPKFYAFRNPEQWTAEDDKESIWHGCRYEPVIPNGRIIHFNDGTDHVVKVKPGQWLVIANNKHTEVLSDHAFKLRFEPYPVARASSDLCRPPHA